MMKQNLMKKYAESIARMHSLSLKVEEEGYSNVKISSLKFLKNRSEAICKYLKEKERAKEICSKIISIMLRETT
jgi:hypothetical protein